MKNLKKLFIFILILPLVFVMTACGKKKNNNSTTTPTVPEQQVPETPSQPETPSEEEPPVETENETFSVNYTYNLPEDYSHLLSDFSESELEVGKTKNVAEITDTKLAPYFIGWFIGSEKIETVSGQKDETIELVGSWNENELRKYYYSDGLTIELSGEDAVVSAYSGTQNKVIIPQLFSVDETDYTVAKIGDGCFQDNGVNKVVLNVPSIEIGDLAFKNSALRSFDFDLVKSVGDESFYGTRITEAVFSDKLQNFGTSVFYECNSLETVDFSEVLNINISAVPDYTFCGCESLENVELSSGMTTIGRYGFFGCESLQNINFATNITSFGASVFGNCIGLKNVIVPAGITELDSTMFHGAIDITDITVYRIFELVGVDSSFSAFFEELQDTLTTITIGGFDVRKLPRGYFAGFSALETVVLSPSIIEIEDYCFRDCENLENINLLSSNIAPETFSIRAIEDTKYFKELTSPLIIGNVLLMASNNVSQNIVIPSTVTKIQSNVFYGNTKIVSVSISNTVTEIGAYAFAYCTNLVSVTFEAGNEIESLSNYVFYNSSKLETINLSDLEELKSLGSGLIAGTSVSVVEIPKNLETIGNGAFTNCPISSFSIHEESVRFKNINNDGVLYEDDGEGNVTLIAYPKLKTDEIFFVPSEVTNISAKAFQGNTILKYVYFESEVVWDTYTNAYGMPVSAPFKDTSIVVISESDEIVAPGTQTYYRNDSFFDYDETAETVIVAGSPEFEAQYYYAEIEVDGTTKKFLIEVDGLGGITHFREILVEE